MLAPEAAGHFITVGYINKYFSVKGIFLYGFDMIPYPNSRQLILPNSSCSLLPEENPTVRCFVARESKDTFVFEGAFKMWTVVLVFDGSL